MHLEEREEDVSRHVSSILLMTIEGGKKKKTKHTLGIDPVSIQVRERRLVTAMLNGLRRLLVDDTTGSPPSTRLALSHLRLRTQPVMTGVDLRREGDGTGNE